MKMTTPDPFPLNTPVYTPHGRGTVVAYSRLKHSRYVVEYPGQDRKLYRADELRRADVPLAMQSQVRGTP
jgi:hypothetical protein